MEYCYVILGAFVVCYVFAILCLPWIHVFAIFRRELCPCGCRVRCLRMRVTCRMWVQCSMSLYVRAECYVLIMLVKSYVLVCECRVFASRNVGAEFRVFVCGCQALCPHTRVPILCLGMCVPCFFSVFVSQFHVLAVTDLHHHRIMALNPYDLLGSMCDPTVRQTTHHWRPYVWDRVGIIHLHIDKFTPLQVYTFS